MLALVLVHKLQRGVTWAYLIQLNKTYLPRDWLKNKSRRTIITVTHDEVICQSASANIPNLANLNLS